MRGLICFRLGWFCTKWPRDFYRLQARAGGGVRCNLFHLMENSLRSCAEWFKIVAKLRFGSPTAMEVANGLLQSSRRIFLSSKEWHGRRMEKR